MPEYAVASLMVAKGQLALSYDYRFQAPTLGLAQMHLQDRGATFYPGPLYERSMYASGIGRLYPILHTWPFRFLVEFERDV